MAITVISALPKSAPVASTDTSANSAESSDAAGAGQDFLALLLGLGLQTGSAGQGMPLDSTDTQKDATAQASDADTAAQDSLLAALGIVNTNIPVTPPPDNGAARKSGATSNDSSTLMAGLGNGESRLDNTSAPSSAGTDPAADKANIMASLRATALDGQDEAAKIADDATATKEIGALPSAFSDALNRANSSTTGMSDTSRSTDLSLRTPVKSNDWHQAFSDKIVWMASNEKQSARITLNPEQMGPIEVSLNLDNGSATATFVSANSDVRDSIETALPKLREMFAGIGIELGQANVSSESFKQPASNGEEYSNRSQERNGNGILTTGTTTVSAAGASSGAYAKQQGIGLVDIFA